jgi:hypothetical protein
MSPRRAPPAEPSGQARPSGTVFVAECFWPGVSETKLAAVAERAARDTGVACLELILIPADEIVLGLFRAPTAGAADDAARRAGLPAERIVASVRIRPHPG